MRSFNELISFEIREIIEDYLLGSGLPDGEREEAMAGLTRKGQYADDLRRRIENTVTNRVEERSNWDSRLGIT